MSCPTNTHTISFLPLNNPPLGSHKENTLIEKGISLIHVALPSRGGNNQLPLKIGKAFNTLQRFRERYQFRWWKTIPAAALHPWFRIQFSHQFNSRIIFNQRRYENKYTINVDIRIGENKCHVKPISLGNFLAQLFIILVGICENSLENLLIIKKNLLEIQFNV